MSFKTNEAADSSILSQGLVPSEARACCLYLHRPPPYTHAKANLEKQIIGRDICFNDLLDQKAAYFLGYFYPLKEWSGILDCRDLLKKDFFQSDKFPAYSVMLEALINGHFTQSKKFEEFRFPADLLVQDEYFEQRIALFSQILTWLSNAKLKTLRVVLLPELPPLGLTEPLPADSEQDDVRAHLIQVLQEFFEDTRVARAYFPISLPSHAMPIAEAQDTLVLAALQDANKALISIEETELVELDLTKGNIASRQLGHITPLKSKDLFTAIATNPYIRKLILPNEWQERETNRDFLDSFNMLATSISLESVTYANGRPCLTDMVIARCAQNKEDHEKFSHDLISLVTTLLESPSQEEPDPEAKQDEIEVHLDCKAMTGHQFRELIDTMKQCNVSTPKRCVYFKTFNIPQALFIGTKGRSRWRELQSLRSYQFDLISYQLYTGRSIEQPPYLYSESEYKSEARPMTLERVKATTAHISHDQMRALEENILIAVGPALDRSKKRMEQPVSPEQWENVLAAGRKAIWPMRYHEVQELNLTDVESFVGWPFSLFLECLSLRGDAMHTIVMPSFLKMKKCTDRNHEVSLSRFTDMVLQRLAIIRTLRRIELPVATFYHAQSQSNGALIPCRLVMMEQLKKHLFGVHATDAINSSRVTELIGLPICYNASDFEEHQQIQGALRLKTATNVDNPGSIIFGEDFGPEEVEQALARMFSKGGRGMAEEIAIEADIISPQLVINFAKNIHKNVSLERFRLPEDFAKGQPRKLLLAIEKIRETCERNRYSHEKFRRLIHAPENINAAEALDFTEFRITPAHFAEFLKLVKAGGYKNLRALHVPEDLFTVFRASGQLLRDFTEAVLLVKGLSLSQVFINNGRRSSMLLSDPGWEYYGTETIRSSVVENLKAFPPEKRVALYQERFAHQSIFASLLNHRFAQIARSCNRRLVAQRSAMVRNAISFARGSLYYYLAPAGSSLNQAALPPGNELPQRKPLPSLPSELWLHIFSFVYNLPQQFLKRLAVPNEAEESRELRLAAAASMAQYKGITNMLSHMASRTLGAPLPAIDSFAGKLESALASKYRSGERILRPTQEMADFLEVTLGHLKPEKATGNRSRRIYEIRTHREDRIFSLARNPANSKLGTLLKAEVSGGLYFETESELAASMEDSFRDVNFSDIFIEEGVIPSSHPTSHRPNVLNQVVVRQAIMLDMLHTHEIEPLDSDSKAILQNMHNQLFIEQAEAKQQQTFKIKPYEPLISVAPCREEKWDFRALHLAFLTNNLILAGQDTIKLVINNRYPQTVKEIHWRRLFNRTMVEELLSSTGILEEEGPCGRNSNRKLMMEFMDTLFPNASRNDQDFSEVVNEYITDVFNLLTNAGFSSKAIAGLILQQKYLAFLHAKNGSLEPNFWLYWVTTITMMCELKVLYDLCTEYTAKLLFSRGANLPTMNNPILAVSEINEYLMGRQLTKTAEFFVSVVEDKEWLLSADIPNLLHFAGATDTPGILNTLVTELSESNVSKAILARAIKQPLGLEMALGPLHACFASPEAALVLSAMGADFESATPEQDPFITIAAIASDVLQMAIFLEVLDMPVYKQRHDLEQKAELAQVLDLEEEQEADEPVQDQQPELLVTKFLHTTPLTTMVENGRVFSALAIMQHFPELAKVWALKANDLQKTVFHAISDIGNRELLSAYAALFGMLKPWRPAEAGLLQGPTSLYCVLKGMEAFIESKGQEPHGLIKTKRPEEFLEQIQRYRNSIRYLLSDFREEDAKHLNWVDPLSRETAFEIVLKNTLFDPYDVLVEFSPVAHHINSRSYIDWAIKMTPEGKLREIDPERLEKIAGIGVPFNDEPPGIKEQILAVVRPRPEEFKEQIAENPKGMEQQLLTYLKLLSVDMPAAKVMGECHQLLGFSPPSPPGPSVVAAHRPSHLLSFFAYGIRTIFSQISAQNATTVQNKIIINSAAFRCFMAQLHLSNAPCMANSRLLTGIQNRYLKEAMATMSAEGIERNNKSNVYSAIAHLTIICKTSQEPDSLNCWKLLLEIYTWLLGNKCEEDPSDRIFLESEPVHINNLKFMGVFHQLIHNSLLTDSQLSLMSGTEEFAQVQGIRASLIKLIGEAMLIRNKPLSHHEMLALRRHESFFASTSMLTANSKKELVALYDQIDRTFNYKLALREHEATKGWRPGPAEGPVRVKSIQLPPQLLEQAEKAKLGLSPRVVPSADSPPSDSDGTASHSSSPGAPAARKRIYRFTQSNPSTPRDGEAAGNVGYQMRFASPQIRLSSGPGPGPEPETDDDSSSQSMPPLDLTESALAGKCVVSSLK